MILHCKHQNCKCNNLVFPAVFKLFFSLIITLHPASTIIQMCVYVIVCAHEGAGKVRERFACWHNFHIKQTSHNLSSLFCASPHGSLYPENASPSRSLYPFGSSPSPWLQPAPKREYGRGENSGQRDRGRCRSATFHSGSAPQG